MSLKDYFKTEKILHSSSLSDFAADVESDRYIEAKRKLRGEFIPPVDFSTGSNFAYYGSAEKYYEDSVKYISGQYPYDGSRAERVAWEVSASHLDRWVLKNRYPRTTGYVKMGDSGKATGTQQNDYGVPALSAPRVSEEFIYLKGGPNAPDTAQSTLQKVFKYGNKYDVDNVRESNLEFKLSRGVTIEFWMHKHGFDRDSTRHEVIFDLWNQKEYIRDDYGRLRLEMSATGASGEAGGCFRLSAWSGSTGFSDMTLGTASPEASEVADATWKHYAITIKNDGSDVNVKLYTNGQKTTESTIAGAALNPVTGALDATIGALRTVPRGTAYASDRGLGSGKLSASLDDFRYWKTERDPKQIGRNWFTNVYGGTNTDEANTHLGVYYKFNEGTYGSASYDSKILDYSGRISNGKWYGYTGSLGSRHSGSAMVLSDAAEREFEDPIIYSSHNDVLELKKELMSSGSAWDMQNNSSIMNSLPAWTTEFNREPNIHLSEMTQIMGSYLDKLHMQITSVRGIKDPYGQAYIHNKHSASVEPVFFSNVLLSGMGFPAPELFKEANLIQDLTSREEGYEFEEDLQKIKNLIYQNVYSTVHNLYKSKGTERAFRNLIRCFGVDEELVKINLYADNSEYTISDNRVYSSVKRKFASFHHPDLWNSTIYQYKDSSVANSRGYISGSYTAALEEHIPFTLECETIFPRPPDKSSRFWYHTDFTTGSIAGVRSALTTDAAKGYDTDNDYGVPEDDNCGLVIRVERPEKDSVDAKFTLSASMINATEYAGGVISSDSIEYEDVYDNTKWNFAARLRPNKWPFPDYISGSVLKETYPAGSPPHTPNEDYILDFYGVKTVQDHKEISFHVSASISHAAGKAFMTENKRVFAGAMKSHVTGSTILKSDVKVTNVAAWYNYLDNDTIDAHATNAKNLGVKHPLQPIYIFDHGATTGGDLDLIPIPQSDTLLLHWNFDNLTESDSTGIYKVGDVSSGSTANTNRYHRTFGLIKEVQHTAKGDIGVNNDNRCIDVEYIPTALYQVPEVQNSSDMVKLLQQDDDLFTSDTRPTDFFFAFEKSMYQTISEEMINMFASLVDFNNIIGAPINKYRMQYKDMSKLRQMFFEKVGNTPDIDKYIEYYKWFDSALGEMLQSMVPASVRSTGGLVNTIESHVLERNKYWAKYPSMEMKAADPESGLESINKHLVNWQDAHSPISASFLKSTIKVMSTVSKNTIDGKKFWLTGSDGYIKEFIFDKSTDTVTGGTIGTLSDSGAEDIANSIRSAVNNIGGSLPITVGAAHASDADYIIELTTDSPALAAASQDFSGHVQQLSGSKVEGIVATPFSSSTVPTLAVEQDNCEYWANHAIPDESGSVFVKDYAKATATITTTGGPLNDETFTLADAAGLTVGFIFKHSVATVDGTKDGDNVIIGVDGALGSAPSVGERIRDAINASSAAITATEKTGPLRIVLTQDGSGASGNTGIDMSGVTTVTATNFTGGGLVSKGVLDTRKAIYDARVTALNRSYTTPVKLNIDSRTVIGGGINFSPNKNLQYVFSATSRGPTPLDYGLAGGMPLKYLLAREAYFATGSSQGYASSTCDDSKHPLLKVKIAHDIVDGMLAFEHRDDEEGSYDAGIKADLVSPLNLIEDDVTTGYTALVSGLGKVGPNVNIVNLHHDTYGPDGDIPMQGPFTRQHVGGRKFRHNNLSVHSASPYWREREEGWLLEIGLSGSPGYEKEGAYAFVGPDYPDPHGPYPFSERPVGGARFRDETAKRPVNIRNIKSNSITAGNYVNTYEVINTSGRGINNLHFRAIFGNLTSITGSLNKSTHATGIARLKIDEREMNFTLPTRNTSSYVFATKFASHGGPEQSSRGFLDLHSEEMSVYNATPYRNLGIRGSGSTSVKVATAITASFGEPGSVPTSIKNANHADQSVGLETLRRRFAAQFGVDSTDSSRPSWHKNYRNAKTVPIPEYSSPAVQDGTRLRPKHDNDFVTHHIPQNDNQYKWIRQSLATSSLPLSASYHASHTDNLQKAGYGHYFSYGTRPSGSTEYMGSQTHPVFLTASHVGGNHVHASDTTVIFRDETATTAGSTHIPIVPHLTHMVFEPIEPATNNIGNRIGLSLSRSASPHIFGITDTYDGSSHPDFFNSLMWYRRNHYGFNPWNQTRASENRVTKYHRKNNTYTFLDEQSLGDGTYSKEIKSFTVTAVDFTTSPALAVIQREEAETWTSWGSATHGRIYAKYTHFTNGLGNQDADNMVEFEPSSRGWSNIKQYAKDIRGNMIGVLYTRTIYPSSDNQGQSHARKRERFESMIWAPNKNNNYVSLSDGLTRADGRVLTSSQPNIGSYEDIFGFEPGLKLSRETLKTSASMWPLDARTNLTSSDPYRYRGNRGSTSTNYETLEYSTQYVQNNQSQVVYLYTPDAAAAGKVVPRISTFRFGFGAGSLMNSYSIFHCNRLGSGLSLNQPAAALKFSAYYARPHTIVSRDSVHNPSAPDEIKARRYLYASVDASPSLKYKLTGAVDPAKYPHSNWRFRSPPDLANPPVYEDAIFELTRSLGHVADGLYVHSVPWEVPAMSGLSPSYDDYEDYYQDIRPHTVDRTVIPEYRISERMDHYVNKMGGDFTAKDYEWLEIVGSLSSSGGNEFADSGELLEDSTGGITSAISGAFYRDFAYSDLTENFSKIMELEDSEDMNLKPYRVTLTADAIMKFLPYDSFYPVNRCEDLVKQFSKSYGKYISLNSVNKDYRDINRAVNMPSATADPVETEDNDVAGLRAFYGPLFAPGVLFNTIKSGIAVDYPVLRHGMVPTASIDRDGGINWQINNEYFDARVPFEALVEPETYMASVPFVDMEPHPDAHINVTASWDGNGDRLYKLMAHNFLAEIPNFFLERGQLSSLVSDPQEGVLASIPKQAGTLKRRLPDGTELPVMKQYRALVKIYKSNTGYSEALHDRPPSGSNFIRNHRDTKLYEDHANYLYTYAVANDSHVNSNQLFGDYDGWTGPGNIGGPFSFTSSGSLEVQIYAANADVKTFDNPAGHLPPRIAHTSVASKKYRWQRTNNFRGTVLADILYEDNPTAYVNTLMAGDLMRATMDVTMPHHPICGKYVPVYETDRLRFRSSWFNPDDMSQALATSSIAYIQLTSSDGTLANAQYTSASCQSGLLNKPLQSFTGSDYDGWEYSYGRPQRPLATDTFMMYSMPSAFGPPCGGGYAVSPAGFLSKRFNQAPWGECSGSIVQQQNLGAVDSFVAVGVSSSIGSSLNGTTYGMHDSTNGYNAPFTPPYYDGQSWALLTWDPNPYITADPESYKFTLADVVSQTKIELLRYEWNFVSGAYGDVGTYGPQGLAMNTNAMHVDASLNLKQLIDVPNTITHEDGAVLSVGDGPSSTVWAIQTKFETPILNFINAASGSTISASVGNDNFMEPYIPPNRVPAYGALHFHALELYTATLYQTKGLIYNQGSDTAPFVGEKGGYLDTGLVFNTASLYMGDNLRGVSGTVGQYSNGTNGGQWKNGGHTPYAQGFPGVTDPVGMWHQHGIYSDADDVGIFMQIGGIPDNYILHGTELPIANPMFQTVTGSPDPFCGAYDKYWDGAGYAFIDTDELKSIFSSEMSGVMVSHHHSVKSGDCVVGLPIQKSGIGSGSDDPVAHPHFQRYFFHQHKTGSLKHQNKWLCTWHTGASTVFPSDPDYYSPLRWALDESGSFKSTIGGTPLLTTYKYMYDLDALIDAKNMATSVGNQMHHPYQPFHTEFHEMVTRWSGSNNPKGGYRHSGSLSGSDDIHPVDGQQVMKWRLNTYGPEAGLTADKVHLQIVGADTRRIVDCMFSPYVRYGAGVQPSIEFSDIGGIARVTGSRRGDTRGYPGQGYGHYFNIGNEWDQQSKGMTVNAPAARYVNKFELYLGGASRVQEYQPQLVWTDGIPQPVWTYDTRNYGVKLPGYEAEVHKNKRGIVPTPSPLWGCSGSAVPNGLLDGNEEPMENIRDGMYFTFPDQAGRTGGSVNMSARGQYNVGADFKLMYPEKLKDGRLNTTLLGEAKGFQEITGSRIPRFPSGERMDQLGGWNRGAHMHKSLPYQSTHPPGGPFQGHGYSSLGALRTWDHFLPTRMAIYNDSNYWPSARPMDQDITNPDLFSNPTLTEKIAMQHMKGKNAIDRPKPLSYPENQPDTMAIPGCKYVVRPATAEGFVSGTYGDAYRFRPKHLSNENNILQRWYSTQSHMRNLRKADENLQMSLAGNPANPGPNSTITLDEPTAPKDCREALSTRRTILSGQFQPKGGNLLYTGSLAAELGFSSDPVKLGIPSESQKIKEAIVAVPYIEMPDGRKQFILFESRETFDPDVSTGYVSKYSKYKGGMRYSDPAAGIVGIPTALVDQFDRMNEFVIPPHLDFTRNQSVGPIVMYIFPFEYELSRRDVTDIWQGVMPTSLTKVKNVVSSICHTLDCNPARGGAEYYMEEPNENPLAYALAGETAGPVPAHPSVTSPGKATFRDLRFMVFKVKQRAAINYFDQTLSTIDNDVHSSTFEVGGATVLTGGKAKRKMEFSYNWPYDYCSLIEVAKLDMQVEMWTGDFEENISDTGAVIDRPWVGKTLDGDTE